MFIVSHLHQLFNAETCQSYIQVAYLGPADKYFGPLVTRLSGVNQPVIRT
jgi:hypothetical protein